MAKYPTEHSLSIAQSVAYQLGEVHWACANSRHCAALLALSTVLSWHQAVIAPVHDLWCSRFVGLGSICRVSLSRLHLPRSV